MTQGYIEDLLRLYEQRNELELTYHKQHRVISKEIQVLESYCDHTLPNGKSADNGGMIMGFCKICNGSLG